MFACFAVGILIDSDSWLLIILAFRLRRRWSHHCDCSSTGAALNSAAARRWKCKMCLMYKITMTMTTMTGPQQSLLSLHLHHFPLAYYLLKCPTAVAIEHNSRSERRWRPAQNSYYFSLLSTPSILPPSFLFIFSVACSGATSSICFI